jgi:hypothetical protein
MARPRAGSALSIPQLESMLNDRLSQLTDLNRQRAKAIKHVDVLDAKIKQLSGAARAGGQAVGRGHNSKSLVSTMEELLTRVGKPLGIGDIVEGVLQAGYYSKSANFRGIVNQTLIKEKKRFINVERGMYAVKK